ncbi:MAG: hypothetical protein ABSD20_06475 [Terriglobales bacterium]|jgi:hypothetical protein
MNRATASASATASRRGNRKRTPFLAAAVLAAIIVVPAFAQMGGGGDMQQKIAALKQSVAENQAKLHHFQWMETQAFTLKGDPKPSKQFSCFYGPDGKEQKNLISPPPEPPSGGRMKQRVIEKKKEEMQDYMAGVKTLLGLYVPPNPQLIQQAAEKGNVSVSLIPGSQDKPLVFKNYAQPGDQMTIVYDSVAKKVVSISINTYMDNPKDVVTLTLQFASLPDGTNYVQQSVLNATAKQLVVTTTNSNYRPM